MNKLAVIVPFYKRHRITKLCFKWLKIQSKLLKFDVIVAGSEGILSQQLAQDFKYIEVPNHPLGRKLNYLLHECKEYDGVIILGSDNFVSNSLIQHYQQIDTSIPVYYSFNDIYIYSKKYNIIRSDFEYTRAGNGIGVARMFTKQTLKLMNYNVWNDNYNKGLDASAVNNLTKKGIKQVILPLNEHYIFDIKIEQNISSHDMIYTGYKENDLKILKQLGSIGNDILTMNAEHEERIYQNEVQLKYKSRVLIDFNDYKTGDIIFLKKHTLNELVRMGYVIHEV